MAARPYLTDHSSCHVKRHLQDPEDTGAHHTDMKVAIGKLHTVLVQDRSLEISPLARL